MFMIKLFTHTDLDGIGCAIVAYLTFGREDVDVEYCDYHNVNDKIGKYLNEHIENNQPLHDYVFITDISVNEDVANLINSLELKNPGKFMLLDHHETAEWLNQYKWAKVEIKHYEGLNSSGTSMLFRHLVGHGIISPSMELKIDTFVEDVRRYDTWDWFNIYRDDKPKELNDLFYLYGRDRFIDKVLKSIYYFDEFSFDETDCFILELEKDRINKYIKKTISNTEIIEVGKYKIAVSFGEQYISEVCHAILEAFPDCDLAAMIDLKRKKISYRTDRKGIDVGQFAKYFGGGGRSQTAGSQIEKEKIKQIVDLLYQ